jgi:hypothetical protein
VDDAKPIILSHNGQSHDELSGRLIKKDADLPFLQTQGRFILHVNCDRLTATAKRQLFSSTREHSREGFIKSMIQEEIINLLKSDDELKRLNEEAREQSLKEKDDAAEKASLTVGSGEIMFLNLVALVQAEDRGFHRIRFYADAAINNC